MDPSVIPAASVAMGMSQVRQAAGDDVVNMVKDMEETSGNAIVEEMQSLSPLVGHQLDIRA